MNIPDKVKIGGHWFDVHLRQEKDGFTIAGQGQHWHHRIDIQADLAQSKQESTLFHEVLHEMSIQQGWDFNEAQVSSISEIFYSFLTDNGFLK